MHNTREAENIHTNKQTKKMLLKLVRTTKVFFCITSLFAASLMTNYLFLCLAVCFIYPVHNNPLFGPRLKLGLCL